VFILIAFIGLTSCNNFENKIYGTWIIDEIDADFTVYTNAIGLKKNHNCSLPMMQDSIGDYLEQYGEWNVYNENENNYLRINTKNVYFNTSFKIIEFYRWQDPKTGGYLMRMTLQNDSILIKMARLD